MITVKKSTDGFAISHSTEKMTLEEAAEELKYALMRDDSKFISSIKIKGNTITVTRRRIKGRSPILTRIFEGSEEEISNLLIAS